MMYFNASDKGARLVKLRFAQEVPLSEETKHFRDAVPPEHLPGVLVHQKHAVIHWPIKNMLFSFVLERDDIV